MVKTIHVSLLIALLTNFSFSQSESTPESVAQPGILLKEINTDSVRRSITLDYSGNNGLTPYGAADGKKGASGSFKQVEGQIGEGGANGANGQNGKMLFR